MKGFIKPKLILPLVTVVLLAGATVGSLAGNFIRAHAQGTISLAFSETVASTVAPGGTLTYTLTLTNTTSDKISELQVADLLPPQLTAITATGFTVTPTPISASVSCPSVPTHSLLCFVRNFEPGAKVTIKFSAKVSSSATGTITNTASAQSTTPPVSVTAEASTVVTRQLIIFLLGLDTNVAGSNITDQIISKDMLGTVPSTVRKVFPNASTLPGSATWFLGYSYFGSSMDNGIPVAYNCKATFASSLLRDIRLLSTQITNALKVEPVGAQVDIYLIGHSLGGVVAFGYLALLEEQHILNAPLVTGVPPLPSNAHLKAVITLDSPIGGVHDSNYLTVAKFIYTSKQFTIFEFGFIPFIKENVGFCPGLTSNDFISPTQLTKIFISTSKTTPSHFPFTTQGAQASLLPLLALSAGVNLPVLANGKVPSNEYLAEHAQTDLGTSFLTIGNEFDFLWDPRGCVATLNPLLHTNLPTDIPAFLTTQFLVDKGNNSGLYGRDFVGVTSFSFVCDASTIQNIFNHREVLTDGTVQTGISDFLTPIANGGIGGTPDGLIRV